MYPADIALVLNTLRVLCEDAAEGYAAAARTVGDPALSTLFDTLSKSRHGMAEALRLSAQAIGQPAEMGESLSRGPAWSGNGSGNAPAPGADLDIARRLFARLKAVWTTDERRMLIEECERADRALLRRLADACDSPRLPQQRRLLCLQLGDVTAALGLLAAARVRLS